MKMKRVIVLLVSLFVIIQPVLAVECYDMIDNDLDGLIDAYDPGCYDTGFFNESDNNETDTLPVCSNYFDDDNDKKIDQYDYGCYNSQGEYNPNDSSEENAACSDYIDNDGDGDIDSDDPGCYSQSGSYLPYDNNEANPQCSDGIDNDYDCVTDYPNDPGCTSPYDNTESPNPIGSIIVCTEEFAPMIWNCGNRILTDDNIETGRNGPGNLVERINNYAFEGEQISWDVLVLDKNGIEKIEDVFVTVGPTQGVGNDIEANCGLMESPSSTINPDCNARLGEEELTEFKSSTMAYYRCIFTVEPSYSMYGEYFVTVEVTDLDGLSSAFDENEFWYFNPIIALTVDGDVDYGIVRPGTIAYSDTLLVGNDADYGSGVVLDMFISGTDFYDSTNSGAKCPSSNQLSLATINYYATNGAYNTNLDARSDAEGYVPIGYGNHFANNFYGNYEIMQTVADPTNDYSPGNILTPGAEIALTLRLNLPEPCNGDFDSGNIFFWGEAI